MGVSRIIKKTSTPFSVMRMGSTKKVQYVKDLFFVVNKQLEIVT